MSITNMKFPRFYLPSSLSGLSLMSHNILDCISVYVTLYIPACKKAAYKRTDVRILA